MMGLIRVPALFKCGINWSGITDIGAMFANDLWKHIEAFLAKNIGTATPGS